MTDALVACLHALLHTLPHGAVALVAMEKRINFCLASLSASRSSSCGESRPRSARMALALTPSGVESQSTV